MKINIFVLFLALLHLTSSAKKPIARSKQRSNINAILTDKCAHIQCPPKEEPLCVKMSFNQPDLYNESVYVSLINRCELRYMQCYQDVIAEEVPMKKCYHKYNLRFDDQKIGHPRQKRNIGIKREGNGEINQPDEEPVRETEDIPERDDVEPKEEHNKDKDNENDDTNQPDVAENNNEETQTDRSNSNEKDDEEIKNRPDADLENKIQEEYPRISLDSVNDDENLNATIKSPVHQQSGNVNIEQYSADCPTVCPARDIMVCARCSHGVYKTFMSTCHVRMFACSNQDEKMEIVARYPCMYSAPLIATLKGMDMKPKGKIVDHDIYDRVLKFINCRERDLLQGRPGNSLDARCKFDEVPKKGEKKEVTLKKKLKTCIGICLFPKFS